MRLPIPLDCQLERTRNDHFNGMAFCCAVVAGLCDTPFGCLSGNFAFKLKMLGLFCKRSCDEIEEELTFGELCQAIDEMPKGSNRRKALLIFSEPLVAASKIDMKPNKGPSVAEQLLGEEPFEEKRIHNRKNLFDVDLLNQCYRLFPDSKPVRHFYWMRFLTMDEYLNAVYTLTEHAYVGDILREYERRQDDFLESRMQYIGHDVASLNQCVGDDGNLHPILTDTVEYELEEILLAPMAILNRTIHQYHSSISSERIL